MKVPKKEDIPFELRERDQWIIWTEEKRGENTTKVPRAPWKYGGKYKYDASAKDPENWTSFEEAKKFAEKREGFGVGFCFSKEDPYVGIDFDDCVDEDGNINEEVSSYVQKIGSYAEISPSGNGLHIIVKGELDGTIKKESEGVEAYEKDRYFTVTGNYLKGTKIVRKCQDFIDEIKEKYGKDNEKGLKKKDIDYEPRGTEANISILDVVPTENLEEKGDQLQGPHPIHGSDNTGMNFTVNPEKNTWFCHHQPGHYCGGGPFEYIAMEEGIIECGEWDRGEGPLKGEKWIKTVEAAQRKDLISREKALELTRGKRDPKKLEPPKLAKKEDLWNEIQEVLQIDVKEDPHLTQLLFFTGLSAYSNEPQNLFLKGPSSAGKTHASVNVLDYFPDEDVMLIGSMSPKALVHQHGKFEDENGNPIYPPGEDASEEEVEEYKEKLRNGKRIVDLQGKIMVFLEAPRRKTFEMLRPILSHDTWEHEHKFAESKSSGIHSNTVYIRGWPATIFCTTETDFTEDLATRSLTISPKMSEEKYKAANKMTAANEAVPLTNPENERKKKSLREYIEKLREVGFDCKLAIPFAEELVGPYPSNTPRDMRDFKKFLALIKMSALSHGFRRPYVEVGDEKLLLSTIEDLKQAIEPFEEAFITTRTGTSKEVIDVYEDVFLPLQGTSPGYSELTEKYAEVKKKPISREWMKTKYINPLEQLGWVNPEPDPDDKRKRVIKIQQQEVKTFENLCKEIAEKIDEETGKKWVNRIAKIPRLDPNTTNRDSLVFYDNLIQSNTLPQNEFLSRYFDTSDLASFGESREKKPTDTKQRDSKVNEEELIELIKSENPTPQELAQKFSEDQIAWVNQTLTEWKKEGRARLDIHQQWQWEGSE